MRLLFSVLTTGVASFPVWRIVQLARGESNSWVKRRGSGVAEDSMVGVGTGVSVRGTGVCEGGIVAVAGRVAVGVAAAGWQAARRMIPRIRSFFMAFIAACFIKKVNLSH
jgi:hypothetical protein